MTAAGRMSAGIASRAEPLPRAAGAVVLRRLSPGDLAAFQAYRADPDVGRYQGWQPMSDADALAFLEEMNRGPILAAGAWTQLGIADAASDRLVGDIGLHLCDDGTEVEIGFTLAPAAQGRGLASAAVREAIGLSFERTPARRVLGVTDARNTASIRLLERVGMQRVAIREVVFRGEACVERVYRIDRPA